MGKDIESKWDTSPQFFCIYIKDYAHHMGLPSLIFETFLYTF